MAWARRLKDESGRLYEIPIMFMVLGISLALAVPQPTWGRRAAFFLAPTLVLVGSFFLLVGVGQIINAINWFRRKRALASTDPKERLAVAELVGQIGWEATERAPLLLPLLTDPDRDVRLAAAEAIIRTNHKQCHLQAVPVLAEAAAGDDRGLARYALTALGRIGPAARAALPEIRQAASSADIGVKAQAEELLRALDK